MAARALGTATISFGLVSIPVKLYSTSRSGSGVSFNLLCPCGSRVKQHYHCPKCDRTLSRSELVKGYEFAKGQFVTFTAEELKALEQEVSAAIEIAEFVPLGRIDPVYFDRPYYLGADKGGDKPYRLLSRALSETGRAALARWETRGKQYLVAIRPFDDGLVLQQLHAADEVRPFADVEASAEVELRDQEVQLALQLVEQISNESFEPERYEDEVKQRVLGAVERKVAGEEITAAPAEEPRAQVIDLMEALKASLGEKAPTAPDATAPKKASRKGPKRAAAKTRRTPKSKSKAAGGGRT